MTRIDKGMGWKPDLPDFRDLVSMVPTVTVLPDEYSIRDKMPPVYDQGQLGSCTANGIGAIVQHRQMAQGEPEGQNVPSRLFIYYEERNIEGSVREDAGAAIRDGMKVVHNLGAPPETDWPYDISRFAEKPPSQAYADAVHYEALKYARCYRTSHYLRAHVFHNRPVVFGWTVYDSFWDSAGNAPYLAAMPRRNDMVDGGHATVVVGYRTNAQGMIEYEIRNSWGTDWADGGHFWMPEAYLLNSGLSSDFWSVLTES